jgi:hypothetical protein
MTGEAIRERSSLPRVENLKCLVPIQHGERDTNVPAGPAYALRAQTAGSGRLRPATTRPFAGAGPIARCAVQSAAG